MEENKIIMYKDKNDNNHIQRKLIGEGGQGKIFSTTKKNIILKIFNEKGKKGEVDKIENLAYLPIPRNLNLTLPLAMLEGNQGYVMQLLEDMKSFNSTFEGINEEIKWNEWLEKYKDNEDFVKNYGMYIKSGGKRRRLEAYIKAGVMLTKLHNSGLVYCDFSPNNIFISTNVEKSNVWLIDTDNINYIKNTKFYGLFTPDYAAPELINQESGSTFYSDCYSFVVSLFKQLLLIHPFDGKLVLENEMEDEWGDETTFSRHLLGEYPWIKDEEDFSNRNDNTTIYYDYIVGNNLVELFKKMFSYNSRLVDKRNRPSMSEIVNKLILENDLGIKCKSCEMDYIPKGENKKCPWCSSGNKIVNVVSYLGDKKIYEFNREFDLKEINIPMRLVEGIFLDNLGENCLKIYKDKERIFLKNMSNLEMDYTMGNVSRKLYGVREITNNNSIILTVNSLENTQENIRLEVNIL